MTTKRVSVTVARLPEEAITELDERIGELWREENIDHDNDELISDDMMNTFNLLTIGYDAAWTEVERLSAALEEAEKEKDKAIDLLGDNLDDKAALILRHGKEITELRDRLYEVNQDAETEQKLNDTLHETNKELRKKLVEAQQTIARQHSKEYGIYNTADCEMFTASKEEVWNYLQNNTTVFQCYSVVMDGKTVITSEPSAGANGKLDECTLDEFFQRFEDEGIIICRLVALGNKEGSDKS